MIGVLVGMCYWVLLENLIVCIKILVLGFLLVICFILGRDFWMVVFSVLILLLIDIDLE